MLFRNLDGSGDWMFGNGLQSYAKDDYAIMAYLATALRTFYSECFFNNSVGVPWFDLLGQKSSDPILLTVKETILNCPGVVRISDIKFWNDTERNYRIEYLIDTIYTDNLQGSFIL